MTAREKAMLEWIAEKVMGWLLDPTHSDPNSRPWWLDRRASPMAMEGVFDPINRISDAMDALEAWREKDCSMRGWITGQQSDDEGGKYFTKLYGVPEVRADTLSRAICEALCAATGFEREGEAGDA